MEEPIAVANPNTTKSAPRVINVDKNAAYPKVFNELQAEGAIADSCRVPPCVFATEPSSMCNESAEEMTMWHEKVHLVQKIRYREMNIDDFNNTL